MRFIGFIIHFIFPLSLVAQFAPQAPNNGHQGIKVDSNIISSWATSCNVELGWLNIADTSLGKASAGSTSHAIGDPNQNIGTLSLGDGGKAILTFESPIINGNGYDFVIFENAFPNPVNKEEAFMEMAFVEVSSDGENFVRFPAYSNTSFGQQSASFSYLDASKIHNLAGKYIYPYGTPFDLEELKDSTKIDIENITHIRIIDVIGTIDPVFCTRDIQNNIINDPYPTAFPSGGFDLNGIGVIHQKPISIKENYHASFVIFPNPTKDIFQVISNNESNYKISIFDLNGKLLNIAKNKETINIENYISGIYILKIEDNQNISFHKIIKE